MDTARNDAKSNITAFGTARAFWSCGTCSHSAMHVLGRAFGNPKPTEEAGAAPLAGGIAQQGYQCGIVWGAALAAGAEAHRRHGSGPQAEAAAMRASQEVTEAFRERNGSIDCLELTDTDWTKRSQMLMNFLKGGPITCTMMSVRFAPEACDQIHDSLAVEAVEPSCTPASCAATLVKRLGYSDEHATMAAGFAGGVGLSGGACGALGAAAWIIGMEAAEEGTKYAEVNARVSQVIDAFVKSSDFEFECSEIVGRTFEDIDDHSRHVHSGGCSEILDTLAEATRATLDRSAEPISA